MSQDAKYRCRCASSSARSYELAVFHSPSPGVSEESIRDSHGAVPNEQARLVSPTRGTTPRTSRLSEAMLDRGECHVSDTSIYAQDRAGAFADCEAQEVACGEIEPVQRPRRAARLIESSTARRTIVNSLIRCTSRYLRRCGRKEEEPKGASAQKPYPPCHISFLFYV